MSFLKKSNNAQSFLVSGINETDLSLEVSNGADFPVSGDFLVTIWNKVSFLDPSDDPTMEILKVTGVSGNVFTIERAQEETNASEHNTNDAVEMLITKGHFEEIEDVIDEHIIDKTNPHEVEAEQINTTESGKTVQDKINDLEIEVGTSLKNVVEDTTPQLGGNLATNGKWISGDGGSKGLFVDTAGKVGIGTSAPKNVFDIGGYITSPVVGSPIGYVSSNINETSGFEFRNVSTGDRADFRFVVSNTIGTKYLAVNVPGDGNTISLFGLARNSAGFVFMNGRKLVVGTFSDHDLVLGTNNTAWMTIKNSGNVGIGTTTPTTKLDIIGDMRLTGDVLTDNDIMQWIMGASGQITFTTVSGGNTFRIRGADIQANADLRILSSRDIRFGSDAYAIAADGSSLKIGVGASATSSTTMTLNSSGNVGIGTTAPSSKLEVVGTTTSDGLKVKTYDEKVNALGTIGGESDVVEINLENGVYITATLTDEVNLSFSGLPSSGYVRKFVLSFSGNETINFPVGTKFTGSVAPTILGTNYEISCLIDSSGNLTVYGVIDDIGTL